MKELEELKAAVKDLQFISERNLFIIQLEHKVEALEEVLTKHNLTSCSNRAARDCVFGISCDDFKRGCAKSCPRYKPPPD